MRAPQQASERPDQIALEDLLAYALERLADNAREWSLDD